MRATRYRKLLSALGAAVCVALGAHAEVVEEIIAWVDGDVITSSDYAEEEKASLGELYQKQTGEELDRNVKLVRERLLMDMIDRKILVHYARALGYDTERMVSAYLKMLMDQQKIGSEEELARLAAQNGMTLEGIKNSLLELHGPRDLIDLEVSNRIAVSDREIEAYYEANHQQFAVHGEVVLREIVLMAGDESAKAARRDEARALRERALAGEDFVELARANSEAGTAEAGGRLGPLRRDELSDTLVGPAFALPVGGISELMETPYGFHIVKVESRIEEGFRPLDEMREEVRKAVHDAKLKTEVEAFLKNARSGSEWCVKPKYQNLLSVPSPPSCDRL